MAWLNDAEIAGLGLRYVGSGVLIDSSAIFLRPESITIGSHSRIDAWAMISANDGNVSIGKHVHVGARSTIQGGGGVVIEDFCGLSYGVVILSVSDDFLFGYMTNPTIDDEFRRVTRKPVKLERHSIIGANSVISPGVTLGFGSAVGALSKVSRTVPKGVIFSGSMSGKVMRRDMSRLEALEASWSCSCSP
jgi:acetyltransferase-like isoleucine patch superfamily enzyme